MKLQKFDLHDVPDYAICLGDILILQEKTDYSVTYLVLDSSNFSIKETRRYTVEKFCLDAMSIRKSNFHAIGKLFLEKKIKTLQKDQRQKKDEIKSLDVAIASCLSIFVDLEGKDGN